MKKLQIYELITFAILVLVIAATATAAHAQIYTDLHDFNPGAGDPWNFDSGVLAQGRDGNFYTESHSGGAYSLGTVFKITPLGKPTVIRSLNSASGHSPIDGMTLGLDGNFYGNAFQGGSANLGTAFKVTPSGMLTVLHNFTNSGDGLNPVNAPVLGSDGNFYATTDANPETIYRVSTSGTFKTLHTLSTSQGGRVAN